MENKLLEIEAKLIAHDLILDVVFAITRHSLSDDQRAGLKQKLDVLCERAGPLAGAEIRTWAEKL
jgi:hypothetical protein